MIADPSKLKQPGEGTSTRVHFQTERVRTLTGSEKVTGSKNCPQAGCKGRTETIWTSKQQSTQRHVTINANFWINKGDGNLLSILSELI